MISDNAGYGMVRHLGPSRRQRLMRQRWTLAAVLVVLGLSIGIFGQANDNHRMADRDRQTALAATEQPSF